MLIESHGFDFVKNQQKQTPGMPLRWSNLGKTTEEFMQRSKCSSHFWIVSCAKNIKNIRTNFLGKKSAVLAQVAYMYSQDAPTTKIRRPTTVCSLGGPGPTPARPVEHIRGGTLPLSVVK